MQWFCLNNSLCLKGNYLHLVQLSNHRQPISAQNGSKRTGSDPFEPRLAFGMQMRDQLIVCSHQTWPMIQPITHFIFYFSTLMTATIRASGARILHDFIINKKTKREWQHSCIIYTRIINLSLNLYFFCHRVLQT